MSDANRSVQAVEALARMMAGEFSALPQVTAVAWGGSRVNAVADQRSDIDLYVYATESIPVDVRARTVAAFADEREIDKSCWEPGDAWIDRGSGIGAETMYRTPAWIEDQLDRVLVRHEASIGYSTCFWNNVLCSVPLFDRDGWFGRLKVTAQQPYPDELRRNIIAKNQSILRGAMPSYTHMHHLESAIHRNDLVSVNQRIAGLLASYFDILFAVNRVPHPGEKRLIALATRMCPIVPRDFVDDITALVRCVGSLPTGGADLLQHASRVIDGLDEMLTIDP